MRFLTILLFSIFCLYIPSKASHIIGAEIGYKSLGGLQYEIYVHIYGDCNFDQTTSAYSTFFTPGTGTRIFVYDGSSLIDSFDCAPYGDYGKEITPVCDRDSALTKCKSPSGTIEGIAEFKFKGVYNLPSTSANWRFAYTGNLLTSLAGRTSSITNLDLTTGVILYLEATLNNVNGVNSTPTLTNAPTPYFCINQPQQYNPGASDADGDALNFMLVDALLATTIGTSVPNPYLAGYSGTQPLATANFNFSSTNGQLAFTPNMVQKSCVVYKIEEKRNNVVVGTAMREMNFTVLNNCSNQSPGGSIDFTQKGTIKSSTVIEICNADSIFNFSIQGQDPDNGNVKVTLTGVPQGMTYSVVGDRTPNPKINVNFVLPHPIIPGTSYDFFVTYEDDNCPFSSKQQLAYTIKIIQPIMFSSTVLPETCVPGNDGLATLSGSSTNSSFVEYSFNGGAFSSINTFSSLSAGIYPIEIRDSLGCKIYNAVIIDTPPKVTLVDVNTRDLSCFGKKDGSVTASVSPAVSNTIFTLMPGSLVSTTGVFDNLGIGTYTLIANAPLGCSDTVTFTLSSPPEIEFNNINIVNNRCELGTGRIEINSNITVPKVYSISPHQQTNSTGRFGGLNAGFYIVTVKDTNGCYKDTLLKVEDDPNYFYLEFLKQDVSCDGDGNDGWAEAIAHFGQQPYTYHWQVFPTPDGTQSRIDNQRSGIKALRVVDAIGCESKGYVIINPANCCEKVFIPNAFTPNGDNHNDIFRMRTPLAMTEVKFIVMNRWGQKVWGTDNHLDGWDGTYSNGQYADVGTYYYFLSYRCEGDDIVYRKKGDIMIIR